MRLPGCLKSSAGLLLVFLQFLLQGTVVVAQTALPALLADSTKFRIAVQENNVGSTAAAIYAAGVAQWAPAFEAYLNAAVGPVAGGRTFEVVVMDVVTADLGPDFAAWALLGRAPPVVDLFLANAALLVCAQRALGVRVIGTLVALFKGQQAAEGYGATLLTSAVSTMSGLGDLAGRTIVLGGNPLTNLPTEAVWATLQAQGVAFWDAPARVVLLSGASFTAATLTDLFAGVIDAFVIPPHNVDIWNAAVAANPALGPPLTLGVNSKFVGATVAFPDGYPYLSSTPEIPEWGLGLMSGADEALAGEVLHALTKLNRSSPAALAGGFATFRVPADYSAVGTMLADIGLAPFGAGPCVRSTGVPATDLYSAIQCPPGKYKLSRADILSSCGVKNITCPWPAAVCVCGPCATVPPTPIGVYLTPGDPAAAAATNLESNGTACAVLAVCLAAPQAATVAVTVLDRYGPTLRASLGLAPPSNVSYRFLQGADAVATAPLVAVLGPLATRPPGAAGPAWQFTLPSPRALGFAQLVVYVDGTAVVTAPTVVRSVAPSCPNGQAPTPAGGCACPPATGLSAPLDPSTCIPLYSLPAVIGAVAGAALLVSVAACAVMLLRAWAAADAAWLIDASEVEVADPPEVVGVGSGGPVVLGTLRGAAVALKRAPGASMTHHRPTRGPSFLDSPGAGSVGGARVSGSGSDVEAGRRRSGLSEAIESAVVGSGRWKVPGPRLSQTQSQSQSPGRSPEHSAANGAPKSPAASFSPSAAFARAVGKRGSAEWPPAPGRSASLPRGGSSATLPESFVSPLPPSPHDPDPEPRGWGALAFGCGGARARWAPLLTRVRRAVGVRHANVVATLGAVLDGPCPPVIVQEHLERGSLFELLHNPGVMLEELAAAIVRDVASGMLCLHLSTPPIVHGDLKSTNVLLSDAWAAKVADAGLGGRSPARLAPEILRGDPPSLASDVYAFGILVAEVVTRREPFCEAESPAALLAVLASAADPGLSPPRRPALPQGTPFESLIQRCWATDPGERPGFGAIVAELRAADGVSVTQALLARVHASEASSTLLHRVLPPRVARALEEGRVVEPEHYDCVTIFFSDIVGFTDISGALPPEKVMNMLNRLYTAFDKLTVKMGLFKVETIGDAYMVAGNIPVAGQEWPCTDHAARIARFALEAVGAANEIQVLEDDPSHGVVHIRVGFHCLFGDTVNTSSRMESNSERDRIHLSAAAAAQVLMQAPELGAHLESRGRITIKGKGVMETCFLHASAVPPSVAAAAAMRVHAATAAPALAPITTSTPAGGSGRGLPGPSLHGRTAASRAGGINARLFGASPTLSFQIRRASVRPEERAGFLSP